MMVILVVLHVKSVLELTDVKEVLQMREEGTN